MKVVKVKLNDKSRNARMGYERYANCFFYIPYKKFKTKLRPLHICNDVKKEYLTVCSTFTIPDNAMLRIKNFHTLAKDYPFSDDAVRCQYSFTKEMNGEISWDKIRLSDLIDNNWWYMSYHISLDMLEIDSFIDKFKRI